MALNTPARDGDKIGIVASKPLKTLIFTFMPAARGSSFSDIEETLADCSAIGLIGHKPLDRDSLGPKECKLLEMLEKKLQISRPELDAATPDHGMRLCSELDQEQAKMYKSWQELPKESIESCGTSLGTLYWSNAEGAEEGLLMLVAEDGKGRIMISAKDGANLDVSPAGLEEHWSFKKPESLEETLARGERTNREIRLMKVYEDTGKTNLSDRSPKGFRDRDSAER